MRVIPRQALRSFSSLVVRGRGSTGHPPLNEPFPGVTTPSPDQINTQFSKETKISTLRNGLRVASMQRSGGMCSIGVVLESGARNELHHKDGVAHFLQKLNFPCTRKYQTPGEITEVLEPYGGIYESQHFRDTAVFIVSCLPDGLDTATDVLSQILLHAQFSDEDIENARESIACELEMFKMGDDQEPIVMDLVHQAAYNNNTVGNNEICPVSTLLTMNRADITNYYHDNYIPSRMSLVGVGVEHEDLVTAANKYFPQVIGHDGSAKEPAVYTGGYVYRHDDEAPPTIGPQELPTLTHVAIGFKSCSHQDDDYVKHCVLNMLMGGGGAFSAGGPGKGMYSRLYLQVLNRYHWMHRALAVNHPYADTGLFTISGSASPTHAWDMAQVLIRQYKEMARLTVHHTELERAKNQLKSVLLMNLEYRTIVLEDIGRQVLASGTRKTATELCEMIESVTPLQIRTIVEDMLESKPSVGAYGDLKHLPSGEEIGDAFNRENGELTNRASNFLLKSLGKGKSWTKNIIKTQE